VLFIIVLVVSVIAALSFVIVGTLDYIPSAETGTILTKQLYTDPSIANYTVTLTDQRIFYIQNNATLYANLQENQTYTFICHINYHQKMAFIDNLTE
jgi:hypothetical protein